MDGLGQFKAWLGKAWTSSSVSGRVMTIGAAILMVSTIVGAAIWSSMPDFKLLRDGISPVATADIVSALDTLGIPNRMNYSGTGVLVPASRWNDANIAISSLGVDGDTPPMGSANSSIFSTQPGHSDSVRTKELSLQRSLERLRVVKSATVHLAIPETSPFRSQRQPPSASVIIEPHANQIISHEMAMSIVHTVASAVEGMDPKNITLTDAEGRLVGNANNSDPAAVRREYVMDLESGLSMKAQDLLASVLGPNRAVVRVTAEVDDFLDKVTTKQVIHSDDKVPLTEKTTSSDQKGGASTAGGVAGAASNDASVLLPGLATDQPISGKSETMETSYDYPRTNEEIHEIGGQVRRLSVSATVDVTAGAPDGADQGTGGQAMTQEQVEGIIKMAVGFDTTRGDQLQVVMTQFSPAPTPPPESPIENPTQRKFVADLVQNASLGLAAVVALLLGMLTLKKMKPIEIESSSQARPRNDVLSELSSRIEGNPEAVSKILAAWISQKSSSDEPAAPMKKAA